MPSIASTMDEHSHTLDTFSTYHPSGDVLSATRDKGLGPRMCTFGAGRASILA